MIVVGNFHAFRFTVSMKGVPSGRQAEGQAGRQAGRWAEGRTKQHGTLREPDCTETVENVVYKKYL